MGEGSQRINVEVMWMAGLTFDNQGSPLSISETPYSRITCYQTCESGSVKTRSERCHRAAITDNVIWRRPYLHVRVHFVRRATVSIGRQRVHGYTRTVRFEINRAKVLKNYRAT